MINLDILSLTQCSIQRFTKFQQQIEKYFEFFKDLESFKRHSERFGKIEKVSKVHKSFKNRFKNILKDLMRA